MAVVLNRPLIIHEQNAVAGLANRVLAYFATRVLAGFPGAFAANRKAQWVGNPVRADIATLPDPSQRSQDPSTRLRILILGGSQGAAALNTLIPESLALMTENERPSVTHQAGAAHAQNLIDLYARLGVKAHIVPYIEDMASSYQAADLVICRAGASTVAEIAAAGVASLFVPLPTAVDDHQTLNAQFLVNRGAAQSMAQSELTAERLSQWLRHLKKSDLISMAAAARLAAKKDATQTVVQICEELAHAL
jgi:UDP-N-acetylglucosamine--N-acetylmuramyl-(pentapeptide) pyrophosphoryl-undecaprenol N-acetylglucosamine transferase